MLGILSEDPPKLLHALPRKITPKGVRTQKTPGSRNNCAREREQGTIGMSRGAREVGTRGEQGSKGDRNLIKIRLVVRGTRASTVASKDLEWH